MSPYQPHACNDWCAARRSPSGIVVPGVGLVGAHHGGDDTRPTTRLNKSTQGFSWAVNPILSYPILSPVVPHKVSCPILSYPIPLASVRYPY